MDSIIGVLMIVLNFILETISKGWPILLIILILSVTGVFDKIDEWWEKQN